MGDFDWTPFARMAGVLGVAAGVAAIGLKLRQPLIISFLFAGILVGPSCIGLVHDVQEIELLAGIGISLLLFVVGLRLDLTMIRTVGPVALATGLGQVAFTSLVGFLIALAFGMPLVTAVYVAVALTFSSTIIIVKLLSDKKEIDSLHGRIAVGFLIVQDIVAILALIGLTAFGGGRQDGQGFLAQSLWILARGLMMLAVVVATMKWVLPSVLRYMARSPELLVLFAIAWAVVLSSAAEVLGFSKEVGAFLAGISLASSPQRDAIGARLVVLRDFLLLFFFIHLGAQLNLADLSAEAGKASVFSVFVLVGNPLIVMIIMGIMGYRKRTSFMSGLAVAQISEFSLILAALGLSLGHIDQSAVSLITVVGLVTIFASTYMILYSGPLYARLANLLSVFERSNPYRETTANALPPTDRHQIIMMGMGNYGSAIAARLKEHGWQLLAVDFDPDALSRGRRMGLPVLYGDVGDPEILAQLPLDRAKWVICTVRDLQVNTTLVNLLSEIHYTGRLALTAANPAQADHYRRLGAHLVLEPFDDAAEQAAEAVAGAVQSLPGLKDWPAVLQEVTLQPGSVFSGKKLLELDLRRELGVSVLAISRAGKVYFNPDPNLRMFPGDRMVLLCSPEQAAAAVDHLRQRELGSPQDQTADFGADEILIPSESDWVGRSLAELNFRNRYGVTVIGIRRGGQPNTSPRAADTIQGGAALIVVGAQQGIADVRAALPAV